MYVPKKILKFLIDSKLVIWIDPGKVDYHVGSKRPNIIKIKNKLSRLEHIGKSKAARRYILRFYKAVESFSIASTDYQEMRLIEGDQKFHKVQDIVANRDNFTDSFWYNSLLQDIATNGVAKHKKIYMRDKHDVEMFMSSYVVELIDSLERDGYDMTKGKQCGSALIGADGALHKSGSGDHRFYCARVLGVSPIPVAISGVHEDWFAKNVGSPFNIRGLKAALAEIEKKYS
tara:strand:- start:7418 stop:8110 length:693 start_codon:yes stop_codon:yes gene_type:complete